MFTEIDLIKYNNIMSSDSKESLSMMVNNSAKINKTNYQYHFPYQLNIEKDQTYDVRNAGPGLGQAQIVAELNRYQENFVNLSE